MTKFPLMRPIDAFRRQPPEFWALVKLVSQVLGYSERGTRRIKRYDEAMVDAALRHSGLQPRERLEDIELAAEYSHARADLLEQIAEPNLMTRDEAADLFEGVRRQIDPPEVLLPMNKQRKEKRHPAYLTGLVNMLTYQELLERWGVAEFDADPRTPLTFARDGMPLRTLFRRMDGAYPNVNQPHATWEIKEYYGTTTFGSRVADAVYETALDGYELNELRDEGIDVEHYFVIDDRFTWWDCGKSYLCRVVDMLHADLLDGAFFGRELVEEWPKVVAAWPGPATS